MKILTTLSSSDTTILDALTNIHGKDGRLFYGFTSESKHKYPNQIINLTWVATYELRDGGFGGSVRMILSYRKFPSNSRVDIEKFYTKMRRNIEQLCNKKGVSVNINLLYRPRYEDNEGIVSYK